MTSRIAVVEDEKDIQALIVEELEDEGYDVRTADNGREGLEMIRQFKPHLILSDITMPEMDGHAMLKELRKTKTYRTTPIVFLSALADRRHIIEGKRLGVDDYVTKPIDFELLLATIEARIREVDRMTVEKEEQMVKLYNSFLAKPEIEAKPKPALVVVNEWMDIEALEDALKKMGVAFIVQHRGKMLDAYLKEKLYSAIFIAQTTNDLTVTLTLQESREFQSTPSPKFLLIENSTQEQDMSSWDQFRAVISVDKTPSAEIAALIAAHV